MFRYSFYNLLEMYRIGMVENFYKSVLSLKQEHSLAQNLVYLSFMTLNFSAYPILSCGSLEKQYILHSDF